VISESPPGTGWSRSSKAVWLLGSFNDALLVAELGAICGGRPGRETRMLGLLPLVCVALKEHEALASAQTLHGCWPLHRTFLLDESASDQQKVGVSVLLLASIARTRHTDPTVWPGRVGECMQNEAALVPVRRRHGLFRDGYFLHIS